MSDPYKAAEAAYTLAAAELGANSPHAIRSAVTAALIAERSGTLGYWIRGARQRVIWFGGWEEANGGGWRFRLDGGGWTDPFPLSVLRVLTFYGWGMQCRLPGTYFVWSWRGDRGMYFSPDGTPDNATCWLRMPRWRRDR